MTVDYSVNGEINTIFSVDYASAREQAKYYKTYIQTYFTPLSHSYEDKDNAVGSQFRYAESSSSSDRNAEIYRNMQKDIIESRKPVLYGLLKESDYEMGFESKAEKYFNDLYQKYEATADTILQNIYLENMDKDTHIIKEILFIIAELPRSRRKNIAYIAIAGLDNENDEVKDLSIRCFEVWNEKIYLSILRNHIFSSGRLERYRKEVIQTIETDGE